MNRPFKTPIAMALLWAVAPALPQEATRLAPSEPKAPQEKTPTAETIVPHPSQLVFPELDYAPPDPAASRHVLPSGVVVFVVEDHELPLVDVEVLVRGGAYLEPPDRWGLSELVSSQLRSGGTTKASPEEFDEELDFLAARVVTSQREFASVASLNCLTKDLDRVLELFFDMLRSPRFDPERLALRKSQLLQDMERRNDETSEIEEREWTRLLRGRDHATFPRMTKASVDGIVREDLVAFHRRYYHPGNLLIAVSGDVKAEDILERLEQKLSDWPGDPADAATAPEPPGPEHEIVPGVYLVDKPDVNQGRVSLGHLSAMRSDPDLHALTVMNFVLGGGGFTSRIMSTVRSDKGLAYSAGSQFELGIYYPGDFRAYFQSKSESVQEAAETVVAEIRRIRDEPISSEELSTAVNYAIGLLPRSFSTARATASTFAMDELTSRPSDFWKTYSEKFKAVTPEDVLRVARAHLHPDRMVVLIVGSGKDILAAESGAKAIAELAGPAGIVRIPLPDPLTLEY